MKYDASSEVTHFARTVLDDGVSATSLEDKHERHLYRRESPVRFGLLEPGVSIRVVHLQRSRQSQLRRIFEEDYGSPSTIVCGHHIPGRAESLAGHSERKRATAWELQRFANRVESLRQYCRNAMAGRHLRQNRLQLRRVV